MKMNTLKGSMTGGIIALLLVAITIPTPAKAATMAELQAQIQSLLAQITLLQKQASGNNTLPAVCTTVQNDLAFGSNGTAVTNLQNFLISQGFAIAAGATGYFGGQTQQAITKYQVTKGLSPANGTFGPATKTKIKEYCDQNQTPSKPVVTPTPKPTTPTTPELTGEASIDRFEAKDGDDTDLEEGDTNVEVMEVSFRVTDGDVKINRADIGFTPDGANNEQDPWDTFSTISIWNGSNKIADIDASKEKSWKEDSPNSGDYMLRLSGFSHVIKKGTDAKFVVKASVQKSVKGTEDGEIWNIFIPDNGIRGLDASNAPVYTGDTADAVTLNLDKAGSTDELLIRRSDNDPNSTTIQVKENNRSGYIEIFAFDIDTDDSKNDIEIRRLPISLTVSNGTINDIVREVQLKVGNKTYKRNSIVNGSTGTVTFEFNRNEFVIEAGDRITVSVNADFNALSSSYEGTTITGAINASEITAKGKDTLAGNQLASAATGETHALHTKGQSVTSPAMTAVVTTASGPANDYVTFSGKISITPFGQDAYIPNDGTAIVYQLTDATGNALSASGTAIITSSAKESGNYFLVPEGKNETITIEVTYQPGIANTTARMQIMSMHFSDSAQPATQSWTALPANKYRTPTKIIVD